MSKHILGALVGVVCASCGSSVDSDSVGDAQPDTHLQDAGDEFDAAYEDGASEGHEDSSPDANELSLTSCGNVPVLGGQGLVVSDECLACVDANCCSLADACADQPECQALRQCAASCYEPGTYCFGDCPDCVDGCESMHEGGSEAHQALNTCRRNNCADECARKPYLECAGSVQWPQPDEPTHEVTYTVFEYLSGENLSGIQVKLCSFDDIMCENSTIQDTTGADGITTLVLPSSPLGIDGYLEVTGEGLIPNLFFFSFTNNNEKYGEDGQISLDPFAQSTADVLASLIGTTADPARGHLVFGTRDCNDFLAAEMKVVVDIADESSVQAYMVHGLPSATATETSINGLGGVINVPPGTATVEMIHEPTQTLVGRRTGILIRAGHVTHTMLPITPL